MSASYYQHVLATEGRTEQLPACQLLVTRRRQQDLVLLPATQVRCCPPGLHVHRPARPSEKLLGAHGCLPDVRWPPAA